MNSELSSADRLLYSMDGWMDSREKREREIMYVSQCFQRERERESVL